MDTYFYLQIILIVIFILYIMYQYPQIFYPQELTEGFFGNDQNLNKEKSYIMEKSIKFSADEKFNNDRYLHLYSNDLVKDEKKIFKKHNVDSEFIKFYNNRKNNHNKKFYQLDIEDPPMITGNIEVFEIIIGEDKRVNSNKFYYTADNNIYCIIKKNNKILYRYYSVDEHYNSKKMEKLIGKERTHKFNKIFNIKKNGKGFLEGKDVVVFEIFETDSLDKDKGEPIAYNFMIRPLSYKFGFQKEKLHKFLKDFNCNTEGFKEWCDRKDIKDKYIKWISITRKSAKPQVTFYYNN